MTTRLAGASNRNWKSKQQQQQYHHRLLYHTTTTANNTNPPSISVVVIVSFTCGFLTATLILLWVRTAPTPAGTYTTRSNNKDNTNNNNNCVISFGTYHGSEYTVDGITIGKPQCLIESKFLKVQQHQVQLDQSLSSSSSSSTIIPDWIWIDYHERINVLVEVPDETNLFYIFQQTKYALEKKQSLAIIGGIVEPTDKSPYETVQREVYEELHSLQCNNFTFLGRYRTDVNRGMGWTNSYLATNCFYNTTTTTTTETDSVKTGPSDPQVSVMDPTNRRRTTIITTDEIYTTIYNNITISQPKNRILLEDNNSNNNNLPGSDSKNDVGNNNNSNNNNNIDKKVEKIDTTASTTTTTVIVGDKDTEPQIIQKLSLTELKKAVIDGKFMEIQWTATVALAILHLEQSQE